MIDEVNFIQSINDTLRDFITTKYDEDNSFYDVWCVFDYEDVQKTFEHMNSGDLSKKPVIHLKENNPNNSPIMYDNTQGKIQRVYLEYSVFCVVDENLESSLKRKAYLNQLSSKLKYKFDNHKDQLPRFRNITINYSHGILGQNTDNLYASSQMLRFEVFKKVQG